VERPEVGVPRRLVERKGDAHRQIQRCKRDGDRGQERNPSRQQLPAGFAVEEAPGHRLDLSGSGARNFRQIGRRLLTDGCLQLYPYIRINGL